MNDYKINNKEYGIGKYTDDTFLLLDGVDNSPKKAFKVIKNYENVSELKVNIEKTYAVWPGGKDDDTKPIC